MATYPDSYIKSLVDSDEIEIEPYESSNVEPASVDLRLGHSFSKPIESDEVLDTRDPSTQEHENFEADEIILQPDEIMLGTTLERVSIPPYIEAEVTGRSSLGRLFVVVHETAGFCDPGYDGQITLEMKNENNRPVKLYAGQRICQIIFRELHDEASRPYGHEGSQYQGQSGATPSGMKFD